MKSSLIFGDCLTALQSIPDKSIDMVLTDPPFGIDFEDWDTLHKNTNIALGGQSPQQKASSFKRRGKPINGWSKGDKNIGKEYQEWCQTWLKEIFRITKQASPILIFNSRRFLHHLVVAAETSGLLLKDTLLWIKPFAHGKAQRAEKIPAIQKSGIQLGNYRVGNLTPLYEPIAYFIKPYNYTLAQCILRDRVGGFHSDNEGIKSNTFSYIGDRGLHPTQKPVLLLEDLIKTFSWPKQIVLDCFCGSGSTLMAAKNVDRFYIGVENNDKYFQISKDRLSQNDCKYKQF